METTGVLREMLLLWPAWGVLVEYVTREDARSADPQSVFGAVCAAERDRLVSRLYGSGVGESLDEAEGILDEVLALARRGRRPRFGRELGLFPEMFGSEATHGTT